MIFIVLAGARSRRRSKSPAFQSILISTNVYVVEFNRWFLGTIFILKLRHQQMSYDCTYVGTGILMDLKTMAEK